MRWIFRVIGAVVVLVLIAVAGIAFLPSDRIAGFAARELSARTGRDVQITGEVSPVFFPVLGVRTGPVTVANAEWADKSPMVRAESLLVGVELVPLFSGEIKIKELRVEGPDILLERSKTGKGNWELASMDAKSPTPSAKAATGADAGLSGFSLDDGRIINGRFRYVDHQTGRTTEISGVDLALSLPDPEGKAILKGSVVYGGQDLRFEGDVARFASFLSGKVSNFTLSAGAGFGSVNFVGQGGFAPLAVDGDLDLIVSDIRAAMGLANLAGGLPDGLGNKAGLAGRLTATADGGFYLRQGEIDIGANALTGDVDIHTSGARPVIRAKLNAGALDFAALSGGSAASSGASTSASEGWSTERMDVSGLHAVDAEIALNAASLDLGKIRFDAIRSRLTLENGRLVADLGQAKAYDGTISGQVVVNGRGGLSLGGDLTATQVQLRPMLSDMADYDRLSAAADIKLKFLAAGNSMQALMSGLSGSGSAAIGKGEIIGFDLAGMLRNLDASFRGAGNKTIFSAITGTFTIKDGVLNNNDLLMESPIVDALGEGNVNIGAQTMRYRLNLVADHTSGGGIVVPILIEGPWVRLSYKADVQNVIDKEVEKQRKEAETKLKGTVEEAKKEAETKLREDVDNAVKEGVEKTLGDLLNKIKP